MSFFDRIDAIQSKAAEKKEEEKPKAIPMPRLSFDEIDALQQEQQAAVSASVRKKPGPKPKQKVSGN